LSPDLFFTRRIKIDEAHERSVYTDLILGVLKKLDTSSISSLKLTKLSHRIRRKRPSLRLIVSSATIDATAFLEYFTSGTSEDEVAIASLEGRMYPVELAYLEEPTSDYVRKAAGAVYNIHLQVRYIL
jgi:ATP-dependent RNA helicase DDX35